MTVDSKKKLKGKPNWAGWHIPLYPSVWEAEEGKVLWVQGQPGRNNPNKLVTSSHLKSAEPTYKESLRLRGFNCCILWDVSRTSTWENLRNTCNLFSYPDAKTRHHKSTECGTISEYEQKYSSQNSSISFILRVETIFLESHLQGFGG